ncbi:MAG: tetratricopeptide repeat protein [Elusimicrobia bacterium]|nr:tetratricopeptide repeat protein [Elusimicrobiota bacterium]
MLAKEKKILKKNLAFLALIILANLFVYRQIIDFKPVNLDEQQLLMDKWSGLKATGSLKDVFKTDVFETGSGIFYRPMLTLSFILDTKRSGEIFEPSVFYKTNLFIHIFNTCLCFALLAGLGYPSGFASAGALVFSLNPVIAGASAWIPGRNDSLLFFMAALALLFLTKAIKRRNIVFLIAHMFFFFAALLTKETAAILIFIFPLWALAAGWRHEPKRVWQEIGVLIGWGLCIAVYWFMRAAIIESNVPFPGIGELFSRTSAYASYLFFPYNPPVYAWFKDLYWVRIIVTNVVVLALFAALWRLKSRHIIVFAVLSVYLFIVPSAFSDRFIPHRNYLPSFFFALALTEAGYLFRGAKVNSLLVMGIISISMAAGTYNYLGYFKNPEAFWSGVRKISPASSEAAYELGYQAHLCKDFATAEKYYLEALSNNPAQPDARNNLGVIYKQTGRYEKAMKFYEEELKLNPGKPLVLENIGNLFMVQGEFRQAIAYYKQKISAEPNNIKTYSKLIFCLRKIGMNADADEYAKQAIALQTPSR